MVVRAAKANTITLNAPAAAAKKLPMKMLAKAKGSVRGRKAEIQALAGDAEEEGEVIENKETPCGNKRKLASR